jgi:hypothetical protein
MNKPTKEADEINSYIIHKQNSFPSYNLAKEKLLRIQTDGIIEILNL